MHKPRPVYENKASLVLVCSLLLLWERKSEMEVEAGFCIIQDTRHKRRGMRRIQKTKGPARGDLQRVSTGKLVEIQDQGLAAASDDLPELI
jgi:hypothetical protein